MHRLPSRDNGTPAVIVKFNDNEIKSNVIKASKRAKLTAASLEFDSNDNIYISDHLIGTTAKLLKIAKNLRNEGKILATWTYNGQVFIRKTEESQTVKIAEESQLEDYKEVIHRHDSSTNTRKLRKRK